MALRTWLFAPANDARKAGKALVSAADAVVLDLEDACPGARKAAAREALRARGLRRTRGLTYVRVNGVSSGLVEDDLRAVVDRGLGGVVLPKAERPADLAEVDRIIGLIEYRRGLAEGAVDLVPLVETGLGLAEARAVAGASHRVRRLAFGSVDFALDLGMRPGPDETELAPHRAALVLASRVAGLEAPIDGAWTAVDDEDGVVRSARRARAEGFQGKLCIHPAQLGPVAEAMAPTAQEIERAGRIVEAFAAAEAGGSAAIALDGDLVDYAMARRAERLLAAAGGGKGA